MADPEAVIPETGPFEVSLEDAPLEEAPVFNEDDPNLVEALMASKEGRECLKEVSDETFRRFTADHESSSEHREQMAEDLRLYTGDIPEKQWPHKYAANMHVPIMLENMSRLSMRTEAEVFSDWYQWHEFQPLTEEDRTAVAVVTKHSNWQFREVMTDFIRQSSRAVTGFYVNGDLTGHSWYDDERKRNVHEVLTPDDFVTPYAHVTVEPDYSDLPHYTKIFRRYKHQMEAMKGKWFDVDKVIEKKPPSWFSDPDAPVREARAEMERIDIPEEDVSAAPYKLLWHEGWFTLYGQTRQRWCQVILDYATKAILKLAIHEEVDPMDKLRYEREVGELELYSQALQARTEAMLGLEAAKAMVPPEPMQPSWVQSPEDVVNGPMPPRKTPIYMFSHGVCLEPLTGNLGLSYGRIQSDFNRAADTALNQAIDQATLSNVGSFLVTENVETDTPIELIPGAFNKVPGVMPGQLEGSIMPLKFPEPSPALFNAVNMLMNFGQTSVQAPSVLSGEAGKSGETYRGISARIEQATKQLSVAARKFAWTWLRQIVKNNAKLNATYMPDKEVFNIFDREEGRYASYSVTRADYARAYQITLTSDMRFVATAQKIAEADELVALPAQVPALQGNWAYQYETVKRALTARGVCDIIRTIGAPPTAPPVFGMPSPELQQMMMMQQQAAMMGGAPQGGPPGGGPPPGSPGGGGPPEGGGVPGPSPAPTGEA